MPNTPPEPARPVPTASNPGASQDQQVTGPRRALVQRLHALLRRDAEFLNDHRRLEALEQCGRFRDTDPACPLHRLLTPDPSLPA